ncbi:MAG: class I SAM-dependent methyltransferase [Actinomycetota bacterium]
MVGGSEIAADAYGEAFADVYDDWYDGVTDAPATAAFIGALRPGGLVLEVGVGTGRLAAPLVAAGLRVVGIDASVAMLARAADRRLGVGLVGGDMRALPMRGPVDVALVAFNTLFNVPTAAGQQAVLAEVARVLAPDGLLVIEAIDTAGFGTTAETHLGLRSHGAGDATVVGTRTDPVAQVVDGAHVQLWGGGVRVRPWQIRWTPTGELDAWAEEVGLALLDRFADWEATPHHEGADVHISVYGRR